MNPPNNKPPGLSDADKKLLNTKLAEFKEKMGYLEKKLHIGVKAVLIGDESSITAKIVIVPNHDFFEHHKKKIITPYNDSLKG